MPRTQNGTSPFMQRQALYTKTCLGVYHETPAPYHALVSLSNLWQSLESQGLKDTRRMEKREAKAEERSIRRCETRTVGYLLLIDLMMREKHLKVALN